MVCVRRPHPSAERRTSRVWEVESTTNSILGLGDDLVALGVERVVLESTSDYWRPFFYLLEGAGLCVWLVNARDVKQVTGRPKTDKLDAVWLAKLNERGMLRPSFVPPGRSAHVRDYTRLRTELVEERSRHKQRLEKLLEDALIKLSSVAADLLGKSARAMIEALIAGERDPAVLADLAHGSSMPSGPVCSRRSTAVSTTTTPISPGSCWTRSTPAPRRSTGSPPGSSSSWPSFPTRPAG